MYICPVATTRNTHAEDYCQNAGHMEGDSAYTHVTSRHDRNAEPSYTFEEIIGK